MTSLIKHALTLTLGWKDEKQPFGPTELDLEAGNLVHCLILMIVVFYCNMDEMVDGWLMLLQDDAAQLHRINTALDNTLQPLPLPLMLPHPIHTLYQQQNKSLFI